MTEKRFSVDSFIKDYKSHIIDNNGEIKTLEEYVNYLNNLNEENERLKSQLKDCEKRVTDKEVEWLRNNTVWEQMPSSKRTFIITTTKGDLNE